MANLYANMCGHRQMGLRYDDLIPEEREDVQKVSGHPRRSYGCLEKQWTEADDSRPSPG